MLRDKEEEHKHCETLKVIGIPDLWRDDVDIQNCNDSG